MRGAWGLVGQDARMLGALVIALALAAPSAMAEEGSASLTARGPLELEGPIEVLGEQAGFVLQDPGTASWSRIELSLEAAHATVEEIIIQEACLVRGARVGVADVDASDFTGQRALPDLPIALPDLPLPSLPLVPPLPPASEPSDAIPAAGHAVDAVADGVRDVAQGAGLPGGLPPAETSCMQMQPWEDRNVVHLDDLTLAVHPVDEAYTIAFDGTDADNPAVVSLASMDGTLDLVRSGDSVEPVGDSETEFRDAAPSFYYPSGLLRTEASSAVGELSGQGQLLIYRANAAVAGTRHGEDKPFSQQYRTGETRSAGPIPGLSMQQHRTLDFLLVTFEDGFGSFRSPGEVKAYASNAHVAIDGTLGMPAAWGHVDVGNRTFVLDGAPARLTGELEFHVAKADTKHMAWSEGDEASGHHKAPELSLNMDGDVSRVETAHVAEGFPAGVAQTAAAVSGFALLAGALAYFWPAVKFGATALYTRIPRDAVLMHGARERIYRLVKD
ncbi:MAG: hypothetical protein LC624_07100, partial [Halobacteriales archaeon]|nr:hypothetical protein [Halobacteriales archaeon]